MISASKTTSSLNNLKILKPNVMKNLTNMLKKFCEFPTCFVSLTLWHILVEFNYQSTCLFISCSMMKSFYLYFKLILLSFFQICTKINIEKMSFYTKEPASVSPPLCALMWRNCWFCWPNPEIKSNWNSTELS